MIKHAMITTLAAGITMGLIGCPSSETSAAPEGHEGSHGGHEESGGGEPAAAPTKAGDGVLSSYLDIHKALAADSTEGVDVAAAALAKAAEPHSGHGGAHGEVATGLIGAAARFEGADLSASREAFKVLSQHMVRYRGMMPAVKGATVVVHCSMANADWVQTSDVVSNPYHGSEMPRCGSITKQRGNG